MSQSIYYVLLVAALAALAGGGTYAAYRLFHADR